VEPCRCDGFDAIAVPIVNACASNATTIQPANQHFSDSAVVGVARGRGTVLNGSARMQRRRAAMRDPNPICYAAHRALDAESSRSNHR
jgi:hypothetical protein